MRRALFLVVLLLIAIAPAAAQEATTDLTLLVSIADEDLYNDIVEQFEAENPGIDVRIVTNPFPIGEEPPQTVDEELDEVLADITQADVLAVGNNSLNVESTRAGYFLDLTPLARADAGLDETDFYQSFWESYQWDGGLWGLPFAGDVSMLFYDPAAFDAANQFYPDPNWTLFDLENAIRALTTYDENDDVEQSAIIDFTDNQAIYAVMLSLVGEGVYEEAFPSVPRFDNPALEGYIDQWVEINREGLLGVNPDGFEGAPMLLAGSSIADVPQITNERRIAAIPGGRPNVTVSAFAVSAGTAEPEAAYELAKFLTFNRDVAESLDEIPARRSLAEDIAFGDLDPDELSAVQSSLENALSLAEMRFTEYIGTVVTRMLADESLDVRTALNNVETEALEDLQTASDRFGQAQLTVQGPVEINVAPGEVALRFGVSSLLDPLPTQEAWDDLIESFVADDSVVGQIVLDVQQGFGGVELADITAQYDCFYLPDNRVPDADLTLLRNMDPLMTTDPNFDQGDFVGNVFEQVRRENQTWALPLVVQPEVMFYNPDVFSLNGVPLPQNGWTVTEFEDALQNIKITEQDPAPFVPQSLGGTYIQVLIAAYGGLPIDYRTTPPTINFNDPAVVQAAIEVLDLAKAGFIEYNGLTENLGFDFFGTGNREDPIALRNRILNPIADFIPGSANSEANELVTFPQGSQLNAVSFDMGTAYISAQSENAEACYRFISRMSGSPQLFNEMPARRSQINSPTLIDEQGPQAADFYLELDRLMSQPTTTLIPTPFSLNISSARIFLTTLWMNRAFDRYVFEDADLQLELQDAQQFATEFLTCSDAIPVVDPTADEEEFEQYVNEVLECATDADPTFGDLLGI